MVNHENFQQSSIHHSFDTRLAEMYSIEEAVLIHHFQFWIKHNKKLKRNLHDKRTWTYQTIEEIAAHFDYLSKKQIERLLNKLSKNKVLIKGNYNKNNYDRTVWYAFFEEEKFIFIDKSLNREIENPKSGNRKDGIGTPIPDTKPYTKPYTKEESKPKKTEQSSLASEEAYDSSFIFSEKIEELVNLLLNSILSLKPDFKVSDTDLNNWGLELDRMIRIDGREVFEIKLLLEWLPSNEFWRKVILCGKTLRRQFDKLSIIMTEENAIKAEKDHIQPYKNFAFKIKNYKRLKQLNITQTGVYDKFSHFELTFLMPYNDFCRCLAREYGIQDYQGDM